MSQETERYQLENNGNTYLARASASGGGTDVEANPEGTATTDLEKLKVGETIYGIPEGTNVVANPTLAGTESALTGLQVGDTKYAVESGMTNPMTTQGDLIVGGANGTPTRLGQGGQDYAYLRFSPSSDSSPVWARPELKHTYVDPSHNNETIFINSSSGGTSAIGFGKPALNFGLGFTTTAPSSANTDGLKIVVLTAEPATYYDGYYYIIAPTP